MGKPAAFYNGTIQHTEGQNRKIFPHSHLRVSLCLKLHCLPSSDVVTVLFYPGGKKKYEFSVGVIQSGCLRSEIFNSLTQLVATHIFILQVCICWQLV